VGEQGGGLVGKQAVFHQGGVHLRFQLGTVLAAEVGGGELAASLAEDLLLVAADREAVDAAIGHRAVVPHLRDPQRRDLGGFLAEQDRARNYRRRSACGCWRSIVMRSGALRLPTPR